MKGVSQERLQQAKTISLRGYLLDKHSDLFSVRNEDCIVYKANKNLVVYEDHSFDFGAVNHAYKDNIGTLRELFGYGFVETVEMLEEWNELQNSSEPEPGFMFIPNGIDSVY